MNEVISKYVEVAVEIIIFSALIFIVFLFSGLSRNAINVHSEQQSIKRDIQHERELSTYINKGFYSGGQLVDNLISGDDVVRFVGKFRHDLEIDIDVGYQTIILEKYSEKADGTSNWDIEVLTELMENNRLSMYKIESVKDEYSGEIMKIRFIKQ